MFVFSQPQAPLIPNVEPQSYDIGRGADWNTYAEMKRIREAQAGDAMRARAAGMLPSMESFAKGRESAARLASNIAMAKAAQQTAGTAAAGSPLAQRQALAQQAALQAAVAEKGTGAVAAEQQAAQKAYIQAAQAQRAIDIQKQIGLEEIAQRQMGMGLQSKWDAAQAQMEFEREKIRKGGIDLGVWDAALKLQQAREAAIGGAIGTGTASVLNYLGSLKSGGGGDGGGGGGLVDPWSGKQSSDLIDPWA